jgi:hypothetical protein
MRTPSPDGPRGAPGDEQPPPLPFLKTGYVAYTLLPTEDGGRLIALKISDRGGDNALALLGLSDGNAWSALGLLFLTIGHYRKPVLLYVADLAMLRSKVWRVGFKLLGIQRQFTQPGSPWRSLGSEPEPGRSVGGNCASKFTNPARASALRLLRALCRVLITN